MVLQEDMRNMNDTLDIAQARNGSYFNNNGHLLLFKTVF